MDILFFIVLREEELNKNCFIYKFRQTLQIKCDIISRKNERATYGDAVLEKLSEKLTNEFGKGFSSRNLRTMRKFYLTYPIWKTVSAKLSWSHYLELIKIEEEHKRNFYLMETTNCNWSVRELQRQIASVLYERLALSKDKNKILELA